MLNYAVTETAQKLKAILIVTTIGVRVIHDVIVRIVIAELFFPKVYFDWHVTVSRTSEQKTVVGVFLVWYNVNDWIGLVAREVFCDVISLLCFVMLGCGVVGFFIVLTLFITVEFKLYEKFFTYSWVINSKFLYSNIYCLILRNRLNNPNYSLSV